MSNIKSALLILVLVTVSQMGFAQTKSLNNNHPMLAQQNENVWSKLKRTKPQPNRQKYNPSPVLEEAEIFSWSGEEWFTNGKVNYQFENDHLVLKTGSVFDGQNFTLSDRTTFEYSDGYLAQEVYEEVPLDSDELQNVERTVYGYTQSSGSKLLSNILYFEWIDTWVAYGKDEFTYSDGVIESGMYYTTDNFNFVEDEKFTVTAQNDTTIITYYFKDGNDWLPESREIYPDYSPQELFNLYMNLNPSYFDLLFSYPMLSIALPDVTTQEYIDEGWSSTERVRSEKFFEMGNDIVTSLHKNFEYWNDDEWLLEEQIEVHFNTNSLVDSAFVKLNVDSTALHTYMKESFVHDNLGNLTTIVNEVDTGEGLNKVMKTEIRWKNNTPSGTEDLPPVSKNFKLSPAYPNPFNPGTNIQYSLEQAGEVSIRVYDLLGREVAMLKNGPQTAGIHTLQFNAENLSSGIYFVRMVSGEFSEIQSITLLK